MKKVYLPLAILAISLASCKKEVKVEDSTAGGTKTDTVAVQETAPEKEPDSAAQMKAWETYTNPGEPHKMMAEEVGSWDCQMTFWMEPGGEPQKSNSTADVKMIMGGRYQEANYKGKVMGTDFEGKSTMAYNNASKEFTATFIDNMGTGVMISNGTYDEASKTINMKGEMVNPMNGKKAPFREVYTIVDNNTRKIEIYDAKDGQEYKSMEILMKRK